MKKVLNIFFIKKKKIFFSAEEYKNVNVHFLKVRKTGEI